MIFINLVIYLY